VGRKEVRKKMRTLEDRAREHEAKIVAERLELHPNEGRIRHWEIEVRAFRKAIDRVRKRLGEPS